MFTKLVCTKSFKNRDDGHQFTEMGLWCHWWTLLKSPLYLDDVALIVRSSLLVVDVGTIFVWIKSEGESWGNFHIVLNMRPIFGGWRYFNWGVAKLLILTWISAFWCLLMNAAEEKVDIMIICIQPKIPQLDSWGPSVQQNRNILIFKFLVYSFQFLVSSF